MTNLEKIVKRQLNELFVGGYEWSFIAKVRQYGKCSPQRIDFDILSLDGSYIFSVFVRGSLIGLKFTAYSKAEDKYSNHYYSSWDDFRICGPAVSPSRKKFIKENLEKALTADLGYR